MRELTYYVAVSLDGYIAGPGGEFDAFLAEGDHMAPIWSRYRGTAPTDLAGAAGLPVADGPFDTVLMGWNTYAVGLPEHHLPNPYRQLRQILLPRPREAPEGSEGVLFTGADPVETVRALKREDGQGIWLCGGGALAAVLVAALGRLARQGRPVIEGAGGPGVGGADYAPLSWRSTGTQTFRSGVTLAEYARA